jgi:glycosyltransferase involved in cell wall biosynthesis
MSVPAIEVIIPVQNMAANIHRCITPLIDQLGEFDVVTVVDDASTDGTGDAAREIGANVLRVPVSSGPYRARQLAASASRADVLLFVDGRCRPLAGLIESHRAMQSRPEVMLSCTDTRTLSGESLAARVAAHRQLFSLKFYVGVPGCRLDYYPTLNLGIRRTAFEQVGGFRAMRSGGDADICWRIQQQFPDSMAVDTRTLMEWEPRTSLRDFISQSYRYGKSYAHLQWLFDWAFDPVAVHPPSRIESLTTRFRNRQERHTTQPLPETLANAAFSLAFQAGYRVAKARSDRFQIPHQYESIPG